MLGWEALSLALLIAVTLLTGTFLYFYFLRTRSRHDRPSSTSPPYRTLMVLGSGGHTSEMLRMASALHPERYHPRVYAVADTDALSGQRALSQDPDAALATLPRSREVGQAWLSTVWTTARAFWGCRKLVSGPARPALLLCNGPGTCVPLCAWAWLLNVRDRVCGRRPRTKIVFVESLCRVRTLSLTGRILRLFVDDLLVQWPLLAEKYPGTKYIDRFV